MTIYFKDALRGTGEAIAGSAPEVGYGGLLWEKQGGTNPIRTPDGYRPGRTQDYASIRYNPSGTGASPIPREYEMSFKLTIGAYAGSMILLDAIFGSIFGDSPAPGYGIRITTEDQRVYVQLYFQRMFNNPAGSTLDFMPHPGPMTLDVLVKVKTTGMVLTLLNETYGVNRTFTLATDMSAVDPLRTFMLDISNNANSAVADFQIGSAEVVRPFWSPILNTVERA